MKDALTKYCSCGECGVDRARWSIECKREHLEGEADRVLYVTSRDETWETTVADFLSDNQDDADVLDGVFRAVGAPSTEVVLGGGAVPAVILVAVAP